MVMCRWPAGQLMHLHRQLAQHVQLLMTSFCAAAALPGHEAPVLTSGMMINALRVSRLALVWSYHWEIFLGW